MNPNDSKFYTPAQPDYTPAKRNRGFVDRWDSITEEIRWAAFCLGLKADEKPNDFARGYALACATLARMDQQPSEVEYLLLEYFNSMKHLESCCIDEYDLEVLRPLMKEALRKKRQPKNE